MHAVKQYVLLHASLGSLYVVCAQPILLLDNIFVCYQLCLTTACSRMPGTSSEIEKWSVICSEKKALQLLFLKQTNARFSCDIAHTRQTQNICCEIRTHEPMNAFLYSTLCLLDCRGLSNLHPQISVSPCLCSPVPCPQTSASLCLCIPVLHPPASASPGLCM